MPFTTALHDSRTTKKDGSTRTALGTRSSVLIPTDKLPKGQLEINEWEDIVKAIPFYDIDKKAWRSMRIDTIWTYQRALKLTE